MRGAGGLTACQPSFPADELAQRARHNRSGGQRSRLVRRRRRDRLAQNAIARARAGARSLLTQTRFRRRLGACRSGRNPAQASPRCRTSGTCRARRICGCPSTPAAVLPGRLPIGVRWTGVEVACPMPELKTAVVEAPTDEVIEPDQPQASVLSAGPAESARDAPSASAELSPPPAELSTSRPASLGDGEIAQALGLAAPLPVYAELTCHNWLDNGCYLAFYNAAFATPMLRTASRCGQELWW